MIRKLFKVIDRDPNKVQPNGNGGRYNAQPAQYEPKNNDWANKKSFKSTARRNDIVNTKRLHKRQGAKGVLTK